MLKNIIELHNEYVIIKASSDDVRNSYHHSVKLDIEDLPLVGKIRISKNGYAYQAKRQGKSVASIVLGVVTSNKLYVDHINGQTLDNRKRNLRACTPSDNARNRHSFSRNNTGTVGVSYRSNGKYEYYRVSFTNVEGKRKTKQFNINKLGKDIAYKAAVKYLKEEKAKNNYIV